MKILELLPKLQLHGRTVWDESKKALFFNWTCSGFSVAFKGSVLKAKLCAMSNTIPAMPGFPPSTPDYPCIGTVLDDGETLCNRQECREAESWYTLFQGECSDHVLRIVKLSENARGKLGILELETDGEFSTMPDSKLPVMEVIGDSITCGFGNEADGTSPEFRTCEENGWMSYAAIAARELGYEYSLICESGICAVKPLKTLIPMHTMEEIYQYTDELYDSQIGKTAELWDFKSHPSDIVVVNLGTNDGNPIRYYQDPTELKEMEAHFTEGFLRFLKKLRAWNGAETQIVCTLGSMDYYLYDCIRNAIETYQEECHDEKVTCFKLTPINMMTEGMGGMGHPSMKSDIRMGHELAVLLKQYVKL